MRTGGKIDGAKDENHCIRNAKVEGSIPSSPPTNSEG